MIEVFTGPLAYLRDATLSTREKTQSHPLAGQTLAASRPITPPLLNPQTQP